MSALAATVIDIYEQFRSEERLHEPPDDTTADDDLAFWDAVAQRLAARETSET